jgi:hypothetical protein
MRNADDFDPPLARDLTGRACLPRVLALSALSLCLFCGGCVNDPKTSKSASDAGDGKVSSKPLLPWAVGNQWTYRVTGGGVVSMKVTEIGAEEVVGGTGPHKDDMAFKVVTEKKDGTDKSISWQQLMGDDKVLRYREQSFSKATGDLTLEEHWDPYKLHIDGTAKHTVAAATWLEEYDETKLPAAGQPTTASQQDRWTVQSADESVTVPAGTFKHALVITKAGGSNLKTYWYVRGIGKIKETGGQTEELVSYQLSP